MFSQWDIFLFVFNCNLLHCSLYWSPLLKYHASLRNAWLCFPIPSPPVSWRKDHHSALPSSGQQTQFSQPPFVHCEINGCCSSCWIYPALLLKCELWPLLPFNSLLNWLGFFFRLRNNSWEVKALMIFLSISTSRNIYRPIIFSGKRKKFFCLSEINEQLSFKKNCVSQVQLHYAARLEAVSTYCQRNLTFPIEILEYKVEMHLSIARVLLVALRWSKLRESTNRCSTLH